MHSRNQTIKQFFFICGIFYRFLVITVVLRTGEKWVAFFSYVQPGKLLSLSFWRDEEAVRRWRTLEDHRQVQRAGRERIFADYRLRVAAVVRDYGMADREEVPEDSKTWHR